MTTSAVQYQPVPIANSELRQIKSSIVGQDYQVKGQTSRRLCKY